MNVSLPTPFPRSYWVEPGRFLAGCLPSSTDPRQRQQRVMGLFNAGIRTIINLMEEECTAGGSAFSPYEGEFLRLAGRIGRDLRCLRYPIRDKDVPTPAFMEEILTTIAAELEAARPVYVHCWGGIGRTGTVVGCWLRWTGQASPDEVLAEIARLRTSEACHFRPAPETPAQRAMVVNWPVRTAEFP